MCESLKKTSLNDCWLCLSSSTYWYSGYMHTWGPPPLCLFLHWHESIGHGYLALSWGYWSSFVNWHYEPLVLAIWPSYPHCPQSNVGESNAEHDPVSSHPYVMHYSYTNSGIVFHPSIPTIHPCVYLEVFRRERYNRVMAFDIIILR